MTQIEKLISIAENEVGYCEKSKSAVTANPAVLDTKTTGAGADNYTKYARDLVKIVGSPYAQGVAWCDMFVDWVMITAFGLENTKKLIGGWSAYTPTSAQYYKNMSKWFTSPKVGDQVFFKNSSRICHTGIVYKIDSAHIYTIEGNTSSSAGVVANGGCVAKKSYSRGYSKIAGYGRPDYSIIKNKDYLYKGVDMSAAQRIVNYLKMKQSGVDFAILKIIRKDLNLDEMFEKHYSGCIQAGIPIFGVYNYSYATTIDKAKNDAQVVIKALAGRRIPVCMDVEDTCQKGLGHLLVDIINAYQKVISDAGLPFMLYTGMSFYDSFIKPYEADLNCKDIWMARYYKGDVIMPYNEDPDQSKVPMNNLVGWQYTSHGSVSGYNNNIDLSIIYRDIEDVAPTAANIVTKVKTNGANLNIRSTPVNGKVVGKLTNGSVVKVIDIDYQSGWYKLNNGYVSNEYIESNSVGVVVANALNIRDSDSTKGSVIGTYRKSEMVMLLSQSTTGWYLTPKGWVSNNYIKI